MFNFKTLIGINTVHMDVQTLYEMDFSRFEICLGHGTPYQERIEQIHGEMGLASELGLRYSVHHPIYLFDWFPFHYLESFFLDKDGEKRELSMRLLEENLKRLQDTKVEYVVLHFPGVYLEPYMEVDVFEWLLEDTLVRIDEMAERYGIEVLLEYFGSNIMFADPAKWIEKLGHRKNLSLLTDTGHLYFASILRRFNYDEALVALAASSKAFHLWTTRGSSVYQENEYYRRYHHIMPSLEQKTGDGWAFNPESILEKMLVHGKPIIIEASPTYGGRAYFMDGIEQMRTCAGRYPPKV